MKKIILKSKLQNPDNFEDELSRQGLDFGPIYWLHDRVYVPRGYKRSQNLPRLVMRTEMHAVDEPPSYKLILRRHIEDSGVDVVEETPVADYTKTVNIILQLGFKPAGEVSRRRQSLTTKKGTTIYLDQLDDGTSFAKLESNLTNDASVTAAHDKLQNFLSSLHEPNIISVAYFELS